jgi:hypothetical protein
MQRTSTGTPSVQESADAAQVGVRINHTVARDESDQVCVVLVVAPSTAQLELQAFTHMQLRSFETAGGEFD